MKMSALDQAIEHVQAELKYYENYEFTYGDDESSISRNRGKVDAYQDMLWFLKDLNDE